MRVLMVNKFLYPNGGSETYIFKLSKELERQGHEVQFFGMEHEKRIVGNRAEVYTSNMDFHTGKLQKLLYPFRIIYSTEAKKKIAFVLEDFKPDVVHLNNFTFQLTPSIIYAIKKYEKKSGRTVKIVMTAHDSQFVCPNHLMRNPISGELCTKCMENNVFQCVKGKCIHGSRVKSILAVVENRLYYFLKTYRYIDVIICPSYFLKQKLEDYPILRSKLQVMHNFVDGFSDKINQSEKKDYILYFGRYSDEKGIVTLIEACRGLPDIPFVFVGNGPLKEKVQGIVNIVEKGFMTGQELEKTIRGARFCIVPSECYENCPFSVMESQMYGTPVLGANIGGIPELIQENKTGELFQSGNVTELKEKIEELWNNKEKTRKYSENCKDISFDTVEQYCKKLVEIYEV